MPNEDTGFLVATESAPLIQQAIDASRRHNPFGAREIQTEEHSLILPRRGYLMQPVSRGEKALVQLVTYATSYYSWKIDLGGVIFLNHPDGNSSFKLRFTFDADTYDTEILTVENLTASALCSAILDALDGIVNVSDMLCALGHPTQHTDMVPNSDLYPTLTRTYKQGDLIDSLIGSWIFSIHRGCLSQYTDISVSLLFIIDDTPVQLNGPAFMVIYPISDIPTISVCVAVDTMDITQPTPLRGGSKVILLPFSDYNCYGIIAANPRENLFRLDFSDT